MLEASIENMSPEIYEYYREMIDMFRNNLTHIIENFYEDGVFCNEQTSIDTLLKEVIAKACRNNYILLKEKYERYYK